jgi:hypothetical protein
MTTFFIAFYQSNLSTVHLVLGFFLHGHHRLNMELDLQNLFGLLCTAVFLG